MPVKIKKIPQPAPPVYMPPPGMEPPMTQQTYIPPPTMGPAFSAVASTPTNLPYGPVSDNNNIITHTEYELLFDDNKPELVMLKPPNKDKILEQINVNVFDQIQKIIDDINAGYDYVKKTKILLAKLEHFPHLRKYENLIRKATHLDGESDQFSLEKLQLRICNDPWLALFFKKADETRISRPFDKKLTVGNWLRLKQTVIGYYFNFFLQKKFRRMINQDKLPSFCVRCLRMNPTTTKFTGFNIHDIKNKVRDGSPPEPIFLAQKYVEFAPMHKDDFAIGKYSDIFDLLKSADYKFEDDKDNEDVVKKAKEAGSKDVSGDIAKESSDMDYYGADTFSSEAWLTEWGGWLTTGFNKMGSSFNRIMMGPGVDEYGDAIDGTAVVAQPNLTSDPAESKISIGTIKKIADNNYQQTGFFYTLCLFVDEALENCRQQYEARNGPINWDKTSQTMDKAVNLSELVERNRMRKVLNELVKSVEDATEKSKIEVKICKMSVSDYKDIVDDIDAQLIKQLKAFIADTKKGTKTTNSYKDKAEFDLAWNKAKQEAEKLSVTHTDKKVWMKLTKLTDTEWKGGLFTGTKSVAEIDASDGGIKSPTKSKKDAYKRSPQYDGLKSAYKDGRISKDQFKDGKREIKRSFRRGPRA